MCQTIFYVAGGSVSNPQLLRAVRRFHVFVSLVRLPWVCRVFLRRVGVGLFGTDLQMGAKRGSRVHLEHMSKNNWPAEVLGTKIGAAGELLTFFHLILLQFIVLETHFFHLFPLFNLNRCCDRFVFHVAEVRVVYHPASLIGWPRNVGFDPHRGGLEVFNSCVGRFGRDGAWFRIGIASSVVFDERDGSTQQ